MDKSSNLTDPCCMILSNMTRPFHLVDRVIVLIERCGYTWNAIVAAFTAKQYNTTHAEMHYLGPVFSNLSQSPHVRRYYLVECLIDSFFTLSYVPYIYLISDT